MIDRTYKYLSDEELVCHHFEYTNCDGPVKFLYFRNGLTYIAFAKCEKHRHLNSSVYYEVTAEDYFTSQVIDS